MVASEIRVGIVGVGSRGASSFANIISEYASARLVAMADIDESVLHDAKDEFSVEEGYLSYETMLEESVIDAVCLCTPIKYHAEQSIMALDRDIHVLSEVPAVVSIPEAREVVKAVDRSRASYMMFENYLHNRSNELVHAIYDDGLFGETYYAASTTNSRLVGPHGVHSHETWRRVDIVGRAGITYPTHMLGPLLRFFPGDRIDRVACEGSGHHYVDGAGIRYEQDDSTVLLAKTEQGRLLQIRQDFISHGPNERTYHLQGTDGRAEWGSDRERIWLNGHCPDMDTWQGLDAFEESHLPAHWKKPPSHVRGDDYFALIEFLDAIIDDRTPPVDIHAALDMTIPGIISEQSIQEGGRWTPVPDSREW